MNSTENTTTTLERLRLAEDRYDKSRDALMNFAKFHLPDRCRIRFASETGQKVFEHSAVYGNRVWPAELQRQFGEVASRANQFLIAIPRFRKLLDSSFEAYMEVSEFRYQDELDREDHQIAIENTYGMIEREMSADVRDECRELGLVG